MLHSRSLRIAGEVSARKNTGVRGNPFVFSFDLTFCTDPSC